MVFEDRHEVVFERVKLGEDVKMMDIVVDNRNGSMNHVFRMEESEFPGMYLEKLSLNPSRDMHIYSLEVWQFIQAKVFGTKLSYWAFDHVVSSFLDGENYLEM